MGTSGSTVLLPDRESTGASRSQSAPCDACGGLGYVRCGDRMRECDCLVVGDALGKIPPRYRAAQLEDFPLKTQGEVRAWCDAMGDGLFLFGGTGTGKTHLACGLLVALARTYRGSRFARCVEVYSSIRATYSHGSEVELLEGYIRPDLLVLDDLAAGGLTDFERRMTLDILDRRCNGLRPTVVTSNWNLEQIAARLDDRIASRLSSFKQLLLVGLDRRPLVQRAAKEVVVAKEL